MIVIASIHQPSSTTLELFDNVLLLSRGQTVYFGPPTQSTSYFTALGYPPDPMMSSAEFMLELTNVDFSHGDNEEDRLETLVTRWNEGREFRTLSDGIVKAEGRGDVFTVGEKELKRGYPRNVFMQSLILTHRMALVSSTHGFPSLTIPIAHSTLCFCVFVI